MNIASPKYIRQFLVSEFATIGKFTNEEFIMESLFIPNDYKRHMSVNIFSGLWQCFKSGRSGDFTRLYAEAKNIGYYEARKRIIQDNWDTLGEYLDSFGEELTFDRTPKEAREINTEDLVGITLDSHNTDDPLVLDAWSYVFSRKLFDLSEPEDTPQFYVCKEGKFAGRLIIPFVDSRGAVYYFQGRALGDQWPKYLNPDEKLTVPQSHVVYPYDDSQDSLVICESPLDARSLQLQGVNATATMKSYVSPQQLEILSTFQGELILGFDNDKAGLKGASAFIKLLNQFRMPKAKICYPPEPYKDWNEAHQKNVDLLHWVRHNRSTLDILYTTKKKLQTL